MMEKFSSSQKIAVIGAGAFGGWTALYLHRKGAYTTLVDAWGPGNSRSSSGGESRVIRGTYGPDFIYTDMVARALELWRDHEELWDIELYKKCGVLWMTGPNDEFEKAALPVLKDTGLHFEEWTPIEASKRYPQVNFEGINWAIYEPEAGYLLARRACQAVLQGFLAEGGVYRQLAAKPGPIKDGELRRIELSDGSVLEADQFVFACGPWLGQIFPEVLGALVQPTRQEVFYFGAPAGDSDFHEDVFPAWADRGERRMYGIPGSEWRGFIDKLPWSETACTMRSRTWRTGASRTGSRTGRERRMHPSTVRPPSRCRWTGSDSAKRRG
jgi:glycine/D-amino acid oxidase-like deaminating enzyme